MVSDHCCCCPLGLAQHPCKQGRHCTCSIIHAHHVHVQPRGQPLHPLEVQQQRLPTPWRGTQVDKSTANKNKTHSVQTDPSKFLLSCVVNHSFTMEDTLSETLRFKCSVVVLFIISLLSCHRDSALSSRSTP